MARIVTKPGAFEPYEEPIDSAPEDLGIAAHAPRAQQARLTTFYLSRDRVLGLIGNDNLPPNVLAALQGADVVMASAILSNAVGTYVLHAIASGGVQTLQQLAHDGGLIPGAMFIYNGHFSGKGFGERNKTPTLTLTEKLDDPLKGVTLTFAFSKKNLVNDTAYIRMSGSTHLFAFGYVAEVDANTIKAIPYAIGDLVDQGSRMPMPFLHTLQLQPGAIGQFAGMDDSWQLTKAEFAPCQLPGASRQRTDLRSARRTRSAFGLGRRRVGRVFGKPHGRGHPAHRRLLAQGPCQVSSDDDERLRQERGSDLPAVQHPGRCLHRAALPLHRRCCPQDGRSVCNAAIVHDALPLCHHGWRCDSAAPSGARPLGRAKEDTNEKGRCSLMARTLSAGLPA